MEVIKTNIEGVLIIEPKVFGDNRGYFFESFSQREFDEEVAPKGAVLDVAVDICKGSPTYGQHVAVELTEKIIGSSSCPAVLLMVLLC